MGQRKLERHHGTMVVTKVQSAKANTDSTLHHFMAVVGMCTYHLHSAWLFTLSDLKTIVGPSFVFGATNALAVEEYTLEPPDAGLNRAVLKRLPLVLLYLWINLLPFTINNQITPDAIQEDKINKPWRTLPSKRMTPRKASRLMSTMYLFALALSAITGGLKQAVSLIILGTWYNNFSGADRSCLVRNLLNALGYTCFLSGAMEVALGTSLPNSVRLLQWVAMIAAVIFTTVHLQDMYDQTGDSTRGRKTVPLVIGDGPARWTTAFAMIFWGYACPRFWNPAMSVWVGSGGLAGIVAARSLMLTGVGDDRVTFWLWNLWMTVVFVLPLLSWVAR